MGTRLSRSTRAAVVPNNARETAPRFGTPTTSRSASDAVDNATDLRRGVAQKNARVDGGRCMPLHGHRELHTLACIAHQLILVLGDSVAVRCGGTPEEKPGTTCNNVTRSPESFASANACSTARFEAVLKSIATATCLNGRIVSACRCHGINRTGTVALAAIRSATDPSVNRSMPRRWWVPATITSARSERACDRMISAGSPC